MSSFDVVVSAENDPYLEWQAMLLHHSCLRRLGRAPVVVVHGEGPLRRGFRSIEATGGRVQRAPSFRDGYPPRNAPGTLACVETDAELVVLCDPDLLFLDDPGFETPPLGDAEIGAEHSTYLRVGDENRAALAEACRRCGVPPETLEEEPPAAGVPLRVPSAVREELAREWLACVDLLLDLPLGWVTSMWALALAARRLGLRTVETATTFTNERGVAAGGDPILHYCYGDAGFEKRDYFGSAERCAAVWRLEPLRGDGAAALVRRELAAARSFYGLEPVARSA